MNPFLQTLAARTLAVALMSMAGAGAQAQLVNYGEQLSAYKDARESGVKVNDSTFPAVSAKTRVNRAIAQQALVEQAALVQPDGTLKLPDNQSNIVIRSNYSTVQNSNGQLRIASPTIQGNVNGNVTLFVEGKGVENITVINNGGSNR
jgi:hypothetical protein